MKNSMKSLCNISPGTVIEGKWHQNRYHIIKEIGYGANGVVYLAQSGNKNVALKMSDNSMSVTSEVNVLKAFAKVQGSTLGPSLVDVDDWEHRGGKVSYYVMEYIKGPDFLTFIQQKGKTWITVLILQLLNDLAILHDKGWVFGDLKPENLIVMGPPPRIRCIDVGGTTIQGRAIKEFTEFYDRGYWGLGSRKAEPSYDLFAVAMIIINTEYPKRFNKSTGGISELKGYIQQSKHLQEFEDILMSALQGKYQSAREMRLDILDKMSAPTGPSIGHRQKNRNRKARVKQTSKNTQVRSRRNRKSSWIETILIVSIISFLYIIYIFGQVY